MDVPWYLWDTGRHDHASPPVWGLSDAEPDWARPAKTCLGTGAIAPPGAQSVGSHPSGVGPRLENV